MIKYIVKILFLFLSLNLFATETRGILNISEDLSGLTPGEAITFELILVPFEKENFKAEDIESDFFLDVFYVNEVLSVNVSDQNADATVVKLNMTLTKEVKWEGFKIWQYGDLNIPIELNLVDVVEAQPISGASPTMFEEEYVFNRKLKWYEWFGIVLLIAGIGTVITKLLEKRKTQKSEVQLTLGFMKSMKSHEDLEELYQKRRVVIAEAEKKGLKAGVESFFLEYSKIQYSPNWKSKDVTDLIKEASELSKEIRSGV